MATKLAIPQPKKRADAEQAEEREKRYVMRHGLVKVPIRISDDHREGMGPVARSSYDIDDEPAGGPARFEDVRRQPSPTATDDELSAAGAFHDDGATGAPMKAEQERRDDSESRRAFLLRLLSVADNLKRALNYARPNDGLSEGVRLTYRELLEALRAEGVEPIESVGRPFDPSLHEAVAVASGYPREGIVVKEETKGYLRDGQLLRPSRVVVSS